MLVQCGFKEIEAAFPSASQTEFDLGAVVLSALGLLESSNEPGTIMDLPIKWADVRREAKTLPESFPTM